MDKLLLKDEDISIFLQAILNVNVPEAILWHYVVKLRSALTQNNNKLVLSLYQQCKKELFSPTTKSHDILLQGVAYQDIQKYSGILERLLHSGKSNQANLTT